MLSARARVSTLATILALGGLGVLAAPAQAAGATINVDEIGVTTEPLRVTGNCASGSTTAVITISQDGEVVAESAVNVGADVSYSAAVDLSDAYTGFASAAVDCLAYAGQAPLGSAEAGLFILDASGLDADPIKVTVSPGTVALGGTVNISAACPAGTAVAEVLVGNIDADEPFLDEEVIPAADGTVTLKAKIAAANGVTPTAGDAGIVVFCGDEDGESLLGIGMAEFRITGAAAVPTTTTNRAASARPTLANTGSDPEPLAAIALAMIAAGGVAIRMARRA